MMTSTFFRLCSRAPRTWIEPATVRRSTRRRPGRGAGTLSPALAGSLEHGAASAAVRAPTPQQKNRRNPATVACGGAWAAKRTKASTALRLGPGQHPDLASFARLPDGHGVLLVRGMF